MQSSDFEDAQEEGLRLAIIRGHTTVGSGGTAATLAKQNPGDAAAGVTARVNDTTIAATGTTETLWAEPFNVRVGWDWHPAPEHRIPCSAAETRIVVRLMAAPADVVTMTGILLAREIV